MIEKKAKIKIIRRNLFREVIFQKISDGVCDLFCFLS